jgi:putative heme transporter
MGSPLAVPAPPVGLGTVRPRLETRPRVRFRPRPRAVMGAGALVAVVALVAVMCAAQVSGAVPALAGVPVTAATVPWLAVTVVLGFATYLCNAVEMRVVTGVDFPLPQAYTCQLAAAFANRVLPAGLGALGVNLRFLTRHGIPRAGAITASAVVKIVGLVVHLGLLAAVVAIGVAGGDRPRLPVPGRWWLGGSAALVLAVAGAGVAAIAGAAVAARGLLGRHLMPHARLAAAQLGHLGRRPRAAASLVTATILAKISHIVGLMTALAAFGVQLRWVAVVTVYLAGSTLAAAVPAPAGIGAVEAAFVAGLVAEGAPGDRTFAAVLAYRLATMWLPVIPGALAFTSLRRRNLL